FACVMVHLVNDFTRLTACPLFVGRINMTLVQYIGQDTEEIAEIVCMIKDAELLDKIGIDPSGIGAILDELVAAEIEQEKVVGISQGWRLGGAIKTTERKLAEGGLVHGGQAMMNWCVSNARVEPRGNAILITKQISGAGKIDPLMALFNAVSLMALNPESTKKDYQIHFI
ncbi:terminase large subunit, partial [Rouxiella badensis]|uniref:terminase TerL endonuclease subunit n=1 Tax=Rouxiella badensis TaxID=1646377 RepID=UPI001D137FE9